MGSGGHGKGSVPQPPLTTVVPKWWRLVRLWFTGDERWAARGYAAAVIAMALFTTLFSVHISYAQRDFSTALSAKDVPGFYKAVWKFVIIIMIAAPLFSFNAWVEERLVLAWRAYLTRLLTRAYFNNRAYYHIRQRGDSTEAEPSGSETHTQTAPSSTRSSGGGTASGSGSSSSKKRGSGGGGGGKAAASSAAAAVGLGGIDNPDQRICDDVAAFVRSSVTLSLTLCRKVFNCVAFAGVLWGVSGHLVLFMFGYAAVGTFVTTALFGRVLSNLYYRQLAREADLRFSLVRVRENAESIAFYRGEGSERSRVLSRLAAVLAVIAHRVRVSALYDLWTSVYSYATILVPSLLTAPRYFKGEIEFGVISQASFAFSKIDEALSLIVNNLAQLSGLAAETERLDSLMAAMAAAPPVDAVEEGDGRGGSAAAAAATSLLLSSAGGADIISRRADPRVSGLLLRSLCVATPGGGALLASNLTLTLEPGQSLLIVGPSGCGKSSLLRAIAGLWQQGGGAVVLPAPEASSVFFLPQRPFMPLGDLRTQLTFPGGGGASGTDAHGSEGALAPAADGRPSTPDRERAPLLTTELSSGSITLMGGSPGGGGAAATHGSLEAAGIGGGAGAITGPDGPATGAGRLSDEELLALLDEVCLPDLVHRVGGLDVEVDWSSVLSAGEQQRVAALRLLAARPALAFLDEATSALDGPTEGRLYGLIRKRIGCYVSVGHRMQLLQHHTHVLECLGGGAWRMTSAAEYQGRLAAATGLHP